MAQGSSYKRENVVISIEGLPGAGSYIIEGYAEGEFCSVEMEGDGWTKIIGSHQQTTRNRMDHPGGTITLTLQGGSPSNKALYDLWQLDKDTGTSPFAITIKDTLSDGKLAYSELAYVRQVPVLAFGDEIQDVEWTIDCLFLKIEHAGQTALTIS